MPSPQPKHGLNFRSKANDHVKAAREHLEALDPFAPLHACLHCRFAIEALAYDLLQNYLFEVSAEAMSRWTPKIVLKELLYINKNACSSISLTIGMNVESGAPKQEVKLDGHQLSAEWANKMHNALGSFLHQPTIRQALREPEADISELARQKARGALEELERVLASEVWSFRAHRLVEITCSCGSLVARDRDFLDAGKDVVCSECSRAYNYRFNEERGGFEFWPEQARWSCLDCKANHEMDALEAAAGKIVECSVCSNKFKLKAAMVLTRIESA